MREHLLSAGWVESKLEPALFYHRNEEGRLNGALVTHVDDIEGGVEAGLEEELFKQSSKALDFATNHRLNFTFRGRELTQQELKDEHGHVFGGHIDVCMKNYAWGMSRIKIAKDRKDQLDAELNEEEKTLLSSGAGELGWITRQLRSDLASDNGCIQRCKKNPTIQDLVRLEQAVEAARRGACMRTRYWSDVDLERGALIHLADSGHAN